MPKPADHVTPTPSLDFIIRKPDLPRYVGLRSSVIADMIARGLFPKPLKLNPNGRAVGWLSSEIEAWQRARAAARDCR
jgi:predicted DNA-binding transcriptional regulator AlpA